MSSCQFCIFSNMNPVSNKKSKIFADTRKAGQITNGMKLGITTIQRDRAPWIKEWIAFHYLVGFRKFYFFDHNSKDNTNEILTKLKKKIDIKIFTVGADLEWPQLKCYQDSYTSFGDEVDWMAFIDSDEFLFPTNSDSMEIALSEFSNKKISALGVYWSCFGSNGYIDEPHGLIIENYTSKAANGYHNNRHIKSIVRGGQNGSVKVSDPHIFQTPLGTYDENLRPIRSGWTGYQPTYEKFRINHYVTQSRQYFLNFKAKFRPPDGSPKRDETFWQEHDQNDVPDNSMDRFLKPLKKILKSI